MVFSLKKIVCCLLGLYYFCLVGAQSDTLLYAAEMTVMPVGARTAALGEAAAALPLNAQSLYYNPALISVNAQVEIWLEGAILYGNETQNASLAIQTPIQKDIIIGALYSAVINDDIPLYAELPATYQENLANPLLRSNGEPLGYFSNIHHNVVLAVAKNFALLGGRSSRLSAFPLPVDIAIGVNFKAYWQHMNPHGKVRLGMNVNADAGLLVSIGMDYDIAIREVTRRFMLGAGVRNALPSKVVWVYSPLDYREQVHNTQQYSVAYEDRTGFLQGHWLIALGLQRSFADEVSSSAEPADYIQTLHAGLEGTFFELVSFRAGISDGVASLGAGVAFDRYRLDYAFRFDQIKFSPIRLSFGAVF
ncbi:MAG: hypothetical protein GF398_15405 [Chitinivibrionales bacterium]|nr:hypothetical protein [Chitinivibrionales bacterium]